MLSRIKNMRMRAQNLIGEKNALERQKLSLLDKARECKEESALSNRASMVLIEMTKALAASSEEKAELLLAMGLNSVFKNQPPFTVSLESTRRRGVANTDIWLEQDGKKSDPSDFGGGVIAILSMLFQVIVIKKAGLSKVLFLDEKLVHVSPEYRPACLDLLKRLCTEAGFEILMTTNQEDYEYARGVGADLIVSVEKKNGKLEVVREEKGVKSKREKPERATPNQESDSDE